MKYFCEACERLVPPAAFRVEDGLLVLKCSRCKVEMRGAIEQDEGPAPAPAARKSDKSDGGGPIIALGQDEAEPDPIENEPTRRMAVPAELLQAIEEEARENRRKKEKGSAKDKKDKEPTQDKAAESVKPPEPVKVAEFVKAPPKTSESGAAKDKPSRPSLSDAPGANLTVLRLSDVQSPRTRTPSESPSAPPSEPPPAAAPPPAQGARASSTSLRVVRDTGSMPSVGAGSSVSEDAFMPPAGFCPKCIGPRKEGSVVCPFCGLDFTRFRQDDFRPSPVVSSTWLGVLELWDSKSAHDKVLALASERGELPALGRLYRVRLARQPEDAMALRGREEVLRLASAGSMLLATPPPDKGTKFRMAALGVFLFMLLILLVAMGVRVWKLTFGAP
ncbi:hypothetical protein D187_001055 [Cystobacter fuscus DSM 2262]|uniref:Uncharacterized protein n=1 Tax=Cystobacter fuscus (strain ATCC 25194 / DSM 2262 / NBRC 100088 / M29) TaxID=1242864 RepID=S9PFU8_CYSF2|nr:hypothetical protein D187_001055 [Cystobacter fuscus DSM 2262]